MDTISMLCGPENNLYLWKVIPMPDIGIYDLFLQIHLEISQVSEHLE